MKRWSKRLAMFLLGAVGCAGLLIGLAWWRCGVALATVYRIDDPPLAMQQAVPIRGAGLYVSRGCVACHGADGSGSLVIDAGPMMQIHAANLTPTGLQGRYNADQLAAAIRHSVRADGTPLVFMPSQDWANLSDTDTRDLVAWLLQLPPAGSVHPRSSLGPLGRLLWFMGRADHLIPAGFLDHRPRPRNAPQVAESAAYGAYLGSMCRGCHNPRLTGGGEIEPGKPLAANINRGAGGLDGWNQADFVRAMRQGQRPDGSAIDPVMPWASLGQMSDTELAALWQWLAAPETAASAK